MLKELPAKRRQAFISLMQLKTLHQLQPCLTTMNTSTIFHQAYFIGIGYQNEVNNVPSEENRTRDYTPTAFTPPDKNHYLASNPVDYLHSGGADAFLDVIKKEIIPYIEQNYRVHKSDRVLIGKSMSGLAAAHAAITRPNLFNRYLIISPAIWWDDWLYERKDRAIMKAEASANALEYSTPTRVYFAVGDAEERLGLVTDMYVLVNKLKRSKRKNIQFYLDVLANEQHEGVFPAAFMKGIVSLYANEAGAEKICDECHLEMKTLRSKYFIFCL